MQHADRLDDVEGAPEGSELEDIGLAELDARSARSSAGSQICCTTRRVTPSGYDRSKIIEKGAAALKRR
jgi:hypothetical protein